MRRALDAAIEQVPLAVRLDEVPAPHAITGSCYTPAAVRDTAPVRPDERLSRQSVYPVRPSHPFGPCTRLLGRWWTVTA